MENKHNTQKEPKMCECNILPPGIRKRMILEGDEESETLHFITSKSRPVSEQPDN